MRNARRDPAGNSRRTVRKLLVRAGRDESGAAAIEYSLIAAIIAAAIVAGLDALDYDAAFAAISRTVSSVFAGL